MNREFFLSYESTIDTNAISGIADSLSYNFTQFKPIKEKQHRNYTYYQYTNSKCFKVHDCWPSNKSKFFRKLFRENLIVINDSADNFRLTVDPLFNFQFGSDLNDSLHEKIYTNTRGVLVQGDIGDNFSFETSFYENQSTFVQYIDDYIKLTNQLFPQQSNYQYNVIPGQGRSKQFKLNGYDYAMAQGYISYSPTTYFNIQVGHGKHFVGDGYRSLLLSDNAFNYPFLRSTFSHKKIQYTNLYAAFMNLTNGGVKTPPGTERLFQKKAASFQMLNWAVTNKTSIGFFQGLIWQAADSLNKQHLAFDFFNPIIFSNAAIYGLNKTKNVLLGFTFNVKIIKDLVVYSQYMIDDFSKEKFALRKKTGYQAGVKYFNAFTIRNLHLQAEYNVVRPYSYGSKKPEQSYTHYNQPLAHPLGANFSEAIIFINYKISNFFVELRYSIASVGRDSASMHFGSNIFLSDNSAPQGLMNNYKFGQGRNISISYFNAHLGYVINPATNCNIIAGVSLRNETASLVSNKTTFVFIGLRTSINNIYYDF